MSDPNILLLHTDQQRFDTIGALGADHMVTPNMDRLVRQGTAFTRAYSSTPVCMPARHDLMTGASARHHGYWGNSKTFLKEPGLATVPRLLTQKGYQTVAVGKMHFNPEREHHGFAHMYLMEELPSCRENDAYLQYLNDVGYGHVRCQHGVRPLFYHVPQRARVPEEHHGSAWVAHKTIEHIRAERDRPFFLFASWVGPHPPFYVPERYLEMYRDRPQPAPCPAVEATERQTPSSPENAGPDTLRRIRAGYFAAISLIDTHIGRILDALEETGQLDRTLILFTTDHGEMLGDRGGYQKHVPYEGSAHIPLIACGPGFEAGRCDTPVTTWDTATTILEAAGVETPGDHPLVGESLRRAGDLGEDRTVVYHHGSGRRRYVAAVSGRHKFIHWFNGGDEEVYDLAADPWEQDNLLRGSDRDAGHAAGRMRDACLSFEQTHGIGRNVRDGMFVDDAYEAPAPHSCSLHPQWSYRQFPRWTVGYSQADLKRIADEMWDCAQTETAFACREDAWRADALQAWKEIGGDTTVYDALFRTVDGS